MGAPLFFSPESELAYPIRWPILLLPPDLGVSMQVVLHLTLAAAGTAYLARTFRVRPLGAAAAGVAFAFSGPALDLIDHAGYFLAASSWIPIAWAASRRLRLRARRRPIHPLLIGGSLAACLLAGEPQSFAIGAAIVLFEARLTALVLVMSAFAIGAFLWAPAWAELALTKRAGALAIDEAMRWSLSPETWPGVLWPGVSAAMVHPGVELHQILAGSAQAIPAWNTHPYLGPLLLASLPAALLVRRARTAAIVFGLGLVFSLGRTLGVLPVLARVVPVFALFRYPAKYLVVTALAAIIVAAVGYEEAVRRVRALFAFRIAAVAVLAIQIAALAAVALDSGPLDALADPLRQSADYVGLPPLSEALLHAGAAATVPIALGLVLSFGPVKRRALACLLLAADYIAFFPDHAALGRPVADLKTPLGALLQPGDILCNQSLAELVVRTSSDRWYKALHPESLRVNLAVDLQACDGVKSPYLYSPLQPSANERLSAGPSTELKARILGCTAMVAVDPPPDASAPPLQAEGYAREGEAGARIHRVRDPLPPVFIARHAVLRGDEDSAVRAVLESGDVEHALAVADDPLARGPWDALPSGERTSIAAVEWDAPDRARVVLAGEGGAVVALRTSYRAGWHARVEGTDAEFPIVRIAGTHLAAVVEDASRPIIFEYRPPHLAFGIAAAAAGLIATGLSSRRAGRRSSPKRGARAPSARSATTGP